MSPQSLLIVTAAPDGRLSTATLGAVVDELRRRPGLRTSLWFLRRVTAHAAARHDAIVPDCVVDDLRTTGAAAYIDRLHLAPVAGLLRGRRLRQWWSEVDPDVVLLDDGLGVRLIEGRRVRTIVRRNDQQPADAELEGAPAAEADLWLLAPSDAEEPAGRRLTMPTVLSDQQDALTFRDPEERRGVRRGLGLPVEEPLVVGWGADPWIDGPDLFVRAVWDMERHHGVVAHGLWLGLAGDEIDVRRLDEEARRCGVEDRIWNRPVPSLDARLCGDVVLLPYRERGETADLREALVTGAQVVTFPVWDFDDPAVRVVAPLDVHAAAAAAVACLEDDRDQRADEAAKRFDVRAWVDCFVVELQHLRDPGMARGWSDGG